jgi:hypothetical protein
MLSQRALTAASNPTLSITSKVLAAAMSKNLTACV